MDKCSHCYIVDRAKLAYCPDCKKVKKTSQDAHTVDVLDKIRAEIEALPKTYPFINHIDTYVKEDDVKKIIDKYKAERSE